ncbi:hypothetical protein J6I39_05095 [bacterium]|nr:hypothetical protein [bacterium]
MSKFLQIMDDLFFFSKNLNSIETYYQNKFRNILTEAGLYTIIIPDNIVFR